MASFESLVTFWMMLGPCLSHHQNRLPQATDDDVNNVQHRARMSRIIAANRPWKIVLGAGINVPWQFLPASLNNFWLVRKCNRTDTRKKEGGKVAWTRLCGQRKPVFWITQLNLNISSHVYLQIYKGTSFFSCNLVYPVCNAMQSCKRKRSRSEQCG